MTREGIGYRKPFSLPIFGKETVPNYCYPREELAAEPIFPYFVMDGGAYHLCYDVVGTTDSDRLLEMTMDGSLFRIFENGGEYRWEKSFAYTAGTGFTPKYEWQIWPQRLYMTIPVAHAFLRTGEVRYAEKWLEIVRGWDENHPYQAADFAVDKLKTDLVWRDMQVAWRTLALLHGLFMLQDAPFTEEDMRYLYGFVKLHADHLLNEAKDRLEKREAQNHVLQIGVALVMAGCLFPEWENAEEYIDAGRRTVEMNMRGAVFSDGGSNEDCPSYNHFIARLYLETYLLLKNNGLAGIEGLEESIRNQYAWIFQCLSPSGRALRFSDSYAMDGAADLKRVGRLFDLRLPETQESCLFPDSRVAVLRKGPLMLAVDAMEIPAGHIHYDVGHQHTGRPEIVLFCGKTPVLVEAGCSNYDRWEFYHRLSWMQSHNVLYCPDFRDRDCTLILSDIEAFDAEAGTVTMSGHVECGDVSYDWERTVCMTEDSVTVTDTADASAPIRWRLHWLMSRQDLQEGETLRVLNEEWEMEMDPGRPYSVILLPVMNEDNKIDYAPTAEVDGFGTHFENVTGFRFRMR